MKTAILHRNKLGFYHLNLVIIFLQNLSIGARLIGHYW